MKIEKMELLSFYKQRLKFLKPFNFLKKCGKKYTCERRFI